MATNRQSRRAPSPIHITSFAVCSPQVLPRRTQSRTGLPRSNPHCPCHSLLPPQIQSPTDSAPPMGRWTTRLLISSARRYLRSVSSLTLHGTCIYTVRDRMFACLASEFMERNSNRDCCAHHQPRIHSVSAAIPDCSLQLKMPRILHDTFPSRPAFATVIRTLYLYIQSSTSLEVYVSKLG